ncbi:MAG: hypothetical protein ACK5RC_04925 [Curvibacter sp.]|nr:hypothetical protein [Curvibacter sp.]
MDRQTLGPELQHGVVCILDQVVGVVHVHVRGTAVGQHQQHPLRPGLHGQHAARMTLRCAQTRRVLAAQCLQRASRNAARCSSCSRLGPVPVLVAVDCDLSISNSGLSTGAVFQPVRAACRVKQRSRLVHPMVAIGVVLVAQGEVQACEQGGGAQTIH